MRLLLVVALVGCGPDSDDVVGPFTGEVHRFVVDRFAIPSEAGAVTAFGDDLDGDGMNENKFGSVTAVLAGTSDLSTHAPDMIASGALASVVEIQADDLMNDDTVGVRYLGADGEPVVVAGGRLVAGTFTSNRTRSTSHPGTAHVHLPVYVNSDPIVLDLEGLEIDLAPDGAGGFDAIVRGGFRQEDARQAAFLGLVQMFETEPERHLVFERGVDMDRDGVMTREEVDNSVIALLVSADIKLFDGDRYAPNATGIPDSISVGFGFHVAPCASGLCSTAAPTNTCRDRVRDGDETDVDCGGSCQKCAAAKTCSIAGDCQSNACDAGHCRAPTCSDGVRDGYESDVDCGCNCAPCALGKVCANAADCQSGACSNDIASLGTCIGA